MEKKLSFKQTILLFSLIFGMFFGAGNLIFPVHLGQLAGAAYGPATFGFLLSSVLLPLLALVALALTKSESVFDLIKPLGHYPAMLFLIALHLCLGPMIVLPRTATVAYSLSFANWLPKNQQQLGLVIFAAIFFIAVLWASFQGQKLTALIGQYLNPIFLVMLALIFILALVAPMGSLHQVVSTDYQSQPIAKSFIEGYNTIDAMAALSFGVTIVSAIHQLGIRQPANVAKAIMKTGALSMAVLALVYVGLILLGVTSLAHMGVSDNGAVALSNITVYYFGRFGQAFLAVMGTLAVFTTAMGVGASFAFDIHRMFPKVPYKGWLSIAALLSFLMATLGLDTIIAWATPVLVFLYPIGMVTVLLNLLAPVIGRQPLVYRLTIGVTLIPALLDGLTAAPFAGDLGGLVAGGGHQGWYQQYFLGAAAGFGWVLPAVLTLIVALILQRYLQQRTAS
ncbi:branched-chain amino acid transport system II carrier protein [Leuconostocaceae bacterium ESL0958]|nr:branched-chain amino acid transport system II carrier protein [Leuconostocaceae bacterium ESL0958]